MEGGELATENMDTLTELGDELTLGDIDGGRRGKEPGGWGGDGARGLPKRVGGSARVSPRGPAAAGAGGVGRWSLDRASGVFGVGALPTRYGLPRVRGERASPCATIPGGHRRGSGARPAGQRPPGSGHARLPCQGSASERLSRGCRRLEWRP